VSPLSTALFVLGYGLSLPIIARLGEVRATGNRLAIAGHQFGISVCLLGWAIQGRIIMALLHLVWLVTVRVWFGTANTEPRRARS
jgi:hypothetical protein